jgi:muconolactone delta-isomerase
MSTRPLTNTPDTQPLTRAAVIPKTLFTTLLKSSVEKADQYRPATADEKSPALKDLKSIEKPGTVAADTVRYVTEDGDHVMVSKSTNPKLYQQIVDAQPALQGIKDSVGEGYELTAPDATAPETLGAYKFIGPPDEKGPGLIRYVTEDGKSFIVSEQENPELFKQVSADFKALSGINASEADGYVRVGADQQAPEKLGDYQAVGPAEEMGPGVVRYVTQNGQKYVVSERDNPELYQQVTGAYDSLSGLTSSEADGYRRAGDNEVWPPYSGITVGPVDEVGPGLIRYETGDGEKVVVAKDDNPKLFEYLAGLHEVITDPAKSGDINTALNNGATLADANTPIPTLNDFKNFNWTIGQEGNTLTYETHDGQKVVVSKDLAPELFKAATTANDTWSKIHSSEAEGYKLAGPDDFLKNKDMTFGSPDELGDGLIRYETDEGKVIVSKELSPQLYDDVVAKWEASTEGAVDDTRSKHDLPPADELDVLNLKTGVKADDKDDSSPELTVSELATKELLDTYREGVKDGSIAKDDPRAKLVRALEAQAAYQNGRGLTGYEEEPGAFGGTWRVFDDKQTELSSADMHDIIDGGKLQEQITTLFSDPTVQADYKGKMDDAINRIPNKDEVKQKLLDLTNNPEYVAYLKDLQNQGKAHEAQEDLSNTLTSLSMFDQDAATKAAQSIQADGLTSDLNDLIGDPSKISDENKELATKDLFGLLKGVLKGELLDMPRRTQEVIEKFLEEGMQGKEKSSAVTKALEELGEVYKTNGSISEADLKTALSKPYIPIADRGALGEVFSALNTKGILGSLGAGVTLFSGIYQLVGDGGKLGETPLQRLSIAKDFLSFAGSGSHFVRLGDKIGELMGKGGMVDFLGLDKTLPEIWGKNGVQGDKFELKVSDLPEATKAKISTALDSVPGAKLGDLSDILGDGAGNADAANKVYGGITQRLDDAVSSASGAKLAAGKAGKIAGSVIKVLGPATDIVGGFADIVLGAFTIKSGIESGDPLAKAAGGLQIAGGAFGASAGVLGAAALVGAGSAAALTGPFFLVGVVLAVVGGIIGYFVDHNKKQKASEKENDWYRDLAADGLLQSDWADKVEYAHYSIHSYGDREAPDDDSLFRFQSAEWQHFDETPQKGGSSSNRLDEDLHVDYDKK